MILDELFGYSGEKYDALGFRNELIWCCSGGGIPKREFPRKHDVILWYSKGTNWTFNTQYRPYSEGTIQRGRTAVKGDAAKLREEGTPVNDWWPEIEKDYDHFGPPLLLTVDRVFSKLRNLTYRYLPNGQLFPIEIAQYDSWVIRESLHNCIAHQDFLLGGRINVVEEPDSLLFTNLGDFLPGSVDEVIRRDAPPEFYRNRFLAEAMVNLNMIDTIGSGIKRMFTKQRDRNFPMPEYNLSEPGRVKVRIIGKVIDERYTRMLMQRTDLSLWEVIALDKIQKGKPITEDEFKILKKKRLIEGRRPNLFVSAEVAAATETKADYIRKRAFDKQHYKKMVEGYLRKFRVATRADFDNLLLKSLSDALTGEQKKNFVTNLLQEMRRAKIIRVVGNKRGLGTQWELYNKRQNGSA